MHFIHKTFLNYTKNYNKLKINKKKLKIKILIYYNFLYNLETFYV